MKIKDHISLALWPPVWITGIEEECLPSDKSEELILIKVELGNRFHKDSSRGYILLSAEFGRETKISPSFITGKTINVTKPGKIYIGRVTILRDPEFLQHFYQKLQNSLGKTIREIGDSEIEVTDDMLTILTSHPKPDPQVVLE